MKNTFAIYQYTVDLLTKLSIKHEIHTFPSGAIMLDIWYDGKFYVLQFEDDFVGFSEISDNTSFDTRPDQKFYDEREYKSKLEMILEIGR